MATWSVALISRIFVQASAEGKFTWTMPSAAEKVKKFTRNMLNYINGDLIGRTNLTNFRRRKSPCLLIIS